MEYTEFLESKQHKVIDYGKLISVDDIHHKLFDWQKVITKWAVRKGRCAIFLDTGLGKTFCQLEWARLIGENTLVIAPLSVARQTVREAKKIDLEVKYIRSQSEIEGHNKLWITNYEMCDEFDYSKFGAVVLDESSILKSIGGKTRKVLTDLCREVPYKLCCTATPAPNDYIELGNHTEFLGICKMQEMLAQFFINANKEHTIAYGDQLYRRKGSNKNGTEWRLKHHAEQPFFKWLASWAITMVKPSDLGYDDDGFILPKLNINPIYTHTDYTPTDQLFFTGLHGIANRAEVRRDTLESKLLKLKEVVDKDSNGQWIIWCGLDEESREATKLLNATEVKGSDSLDHKIQAIEDFQDGKIRIMVTKSKIAGFGMNFQNACNMVFLGINDSWETWYQSIRREWRYGQKNEVNVYPIMHEAEQEIYQNIMRKDAMARRLRESLIAHIRDYEEQELGMTKELKQDYQEETIKTEKFTAMLGDSCKRLAEIPEDSIDLSVYSPPFADLFTYSASEHDLGNSNGTKEFFDHYSFIIREVLRVTKAGRLTCVHTSDIPAMQQRDGYIGLKDFPGDVIRAYEKEGWVFVGRAYVQKNPQALKDGTMVLTPNGYCEINNLKVGDCVIGSDGKPTQVTGVYPHESRQMYKVSFSDGAFIECDANHLWTITKYRRDIKTLTTKEILDSDLRLPYGDTKYEIPIVKPVQFKQVKKLLLHPYLLGVLIGDGCLSSRSTVGMCTDHEIINKLELTNGCSIHMQPNTERGNGTVGTYFITYKEWHKNPVLDALRQYGLYGSRAWEKFIPYDYLRASINERIELLRGLLDTDGTIKKNNAIYYSTTSYRLAQDIMELVRSLGGLCTIKEVNNAKYQSHGEDKIGRVQYSMSIQLDDSWCPFKVKFKVDRRKIRSRTLRRKIVSIEPTNNSTCTCITVENPDGLFVADNYIVTHNSQAIRIHSKALAFGQLRKDSTDIRPALIDQVIFFRKLGDNLVPVMPVENGEMDNEMWIEWAHGIWLGISETDTLQFGKARGTDDEKHICPLQLGTIERCIKLYSNPNEMVLTPFGGIGSEAYMALKLGRRATLIELKPEYFNVAVQNMKTAESLSTRKDLFSVATNDT